jgi:hypothetical protein
MPNLLENRKLIFREGVRCYYCKADDEYYTEDLYVRNERFCFEHCREHECVMRRWLRPNATAIRQ